MAHSSEPIRLVAVDDDPAALEIYEGIAAAQGWHLVPCDNPFDAAEIIHSVRPDVIISDVMMPGMDGFQLCRQLKEDPVLCLVPLILVTGLDSRSDRITGIEAGCDDFLSKPVDRLELLARVRSLARLRRITENLDVAEGVLNTLAICAEARDGTTADHCRRLESAATSFGGWLGLPARSLQILARAGYLHDIGKIAIPDAILLKRGPLDAAEWDVMKSHTTRGADILSPLATVRDVIPIVRHHHERWDGAGYPDGLAGEAIPYLARLFQILDAWDALTNARPYKAALSPEEAMSILVVEAERGRWDPTLFQQFRLWKAQHP